MISSKTMKILGIETSCDETGICIIETSGEKTSDFNIKILGNQLYSQVALHAQYGGVFPMMAKREHAKNLVPLFEKCLEEAGIKKEASDNILTEEKIQNIKNILVYESGLFEDFINLAKKIQKPELDAIAVTNGPGLEPALWVGVCFAKALGEAWGISIIPTNHMEGHIVVAPLHREDSGFKIQDLGPNKQESEKLNKPTYTLLKVKYPAISLLVSGGHTQLVLSKENQKYEIIGNTKDDAIGEAFDKVARILGLPYPGGPQISKLAEKDRTEFPDKKTSYPLPRPMIHSKDLNFSFSGIKTAVLYTVQKIENLTDAIRQEIAREFEDAVIEVIIKKTQKAVETYGAKTIMIGGGVSANKKIRNDFAKLSEEIGVNLMIPEFSASTDNAFMIALAGFLNIIAGQKPETEFKAKGNLSL